MWLGLTPIGEYASKTRTASSLVSAGTIAAVAILLCSATAYADVANSLARPGSVSIAQPSTIAYSQEGSEQPRRNIIVGILHHVGAALALAAMMMAVVFGFIAFDIILPAIVLAAQLVVHATASVWMAMVLVLAIGVLGVYFYRYYYTAPRKSNRPASTESDLAGAERFDLHPDVTRSEDIEETSYLASLEARGDKRHSARSPSREERGAAGPSGTGFPADFLSMFMKSISIFGYIEEPVFHEFSRQLQTRRLLGGECMFDNEEDRDDQNFYVVIDGQVQIFLAKDTPSKASAQPLPEATGESDAESVGAGSWFTTDDAASTGAAAVPDNSYNDIPGAQSKPESAILLNTVGPGDVLSSLFSILSLFTEGVPLHQRQTNTRPDSALRSGFPFPGYDVSENPVPDSPTEYSSETAHGNVIHHAAENLRTHDPHLASALPARFARRTEHPAPDQESHGGADAHRLRRPLRPNVIARATVDTTLAMIPASAFQRVTRLHPKAATHILQVILTRLQRVTFATLYDYLDLPDELVAIERGISGLARFPLRPEIAGSDVLRHVKEAYARQDDSGLALRDMQSPELGTGSEALPFSNFVSPAGRRLTNVTTTLGAIGQLPASWKINRENLEAIEGKFQALLPTLAPRMSQEGGLNIAPTVPLPPSSHIRRHRRAGSDVVPPLAMLPSNVDIERLRNDTLRQLCDSLGLNPYSSDGRYTPPSPDAAHAYDRTPPLSAMSAESSSAHASRRSSMHRRPPRTEHLLPLLQSINMPEQKRQSDPASSLPLANISTLTSELELFHLPGGYTLVEQGQRPHGLYIILDGSVLITHRDSVSDFTGVDRDGEQYYKNSQPSAGNSEKTTSEITRCMAQLALKVKAKFERQTSPLIQRQTSDPLADADSDCDGLRAGLMKPRMSADANTDKPHTHRSYYARAGDLVGYLPALTDMASLYTARTHGSAIVGFISRWALERISERYPIVLMKLARRLTSQLPPAILNIDYALEWVQVKASQMVYRQGESSDAVYVVLSGRLRAFVEGDKGSINILAEFGQSQSVGEPNLLLDKLCKFNLHAIRDTELVRIPRALFRALMQSAPNLTFHLSQTLAVRTAQSLQQQQQQQLMVTKQQRSLLPTTANLEAGIRSHNKNLKSIALIPVGGDVPIHAFAEHLEAALAGIAGRVALLDHTAMSRVLGRHAFSRIARLKIVGWVAELEQRCRLLLHVADGGINSPWTRHCVHHSDFILLVGLGDGDPRVGDYERLLLALKTTARKELVLLHEHRICSTGVTREWLRRRPWVHAHHHLQMPLGYDTYSLDAAVGGHHVSDVLGSARSLLSRSILLPSQRMLPVFANRGLGRIRTSLEKYYRRLTRSRQFTPTTYQGQRSDFARLARYLCGKSVGLVLSGGGARGIALLGVLQAFEEAGIPVDMIGGTSIGALMSGLYAQTPDSVAIQGPLKGFVRRMSSTWRFLIDLTYPILAYTSGREFNRAVWKVFKEAEIEDLWLPFYCISANITRSRSETHSTGLLWRVVRASMSLGGFVPPLCNEDGDLLVDGGYLDNLPVQVMQNKLGASMIFAVDIAGENDISPVRYGASVSGFWILLNHLNPFRSYRIPTLSEVQSRLTYASSDKELESAKIADSCVYLRVPPKDVGVLEFGRFDEVYRRGYEYAKEWTAEWHRAGLLDQWLPASDESASGDRQSSYDDVAETKSLRLSRRNSI
ncbi:phosphatidylcholine and lysophosphatidylcholine phospholipase [Coemansia guatemalensis]|uniref:Lysophospholipase NTE1 n=1 Tax=Coemansia guatemalensis TaxID=2761395 RepID=A0A9W8HYG5_9FUNG|nr:phosphatidylcholine and lysophosphatidylcholine phospholipase [Coemansia guatemalensis]